MLYNLVIGLNTQVDCIIDENLTSMPTLTPGPDSSRIILIQFENPFLAY